MKIQHIDNDQRHIYQCLCVKRMNLQHTMLYVSMLLSKTYESPTHQQWSTLYVSMSVCKTYESATHNVICINASV